MPTIPEPKLPHVTLPNIGGVPAIPHVGSAGASATTYIGKQFGNLPDIHAALHLKTLKKALNEQVYALLQGKLTQPPRSPIYDARAIQLTAELAELASLFDEVVAGVTAEAGEAIGFVNETIADVAAAKAAIEAIPAGARSPVQSLMVTRHTRYLAELNAQVARLQTTIDSIAA